MNLGRFGANRDVIEEFGNFRATFLRDGRAPRQGEVFRNPDLAAIYEVLVAEGLRAFYEGRIADVIDTYLHVQTEAKKLACEDRARYYADPAFYDPPLAQLLSKEYAAEAGGYQAIRWDPVDRVYWGASEMRKDGQVVGY